MGSSLHARTRRTKRQFAARDTLQGSWIGSQLRATARDQNHLWDLRGSAVSWIRGADSFRTDPMRSQGVLEFGDMRRTLCWVWKPRVEIPRDTQGESPMRRSRHSVYRKSIGRVCANSNSKSISADRALFVRLCGFERSISSDVLAADPARCESAFVAERSERLSEVLEEAAAAFEVLRGCVAANDRERFSREDEVAKAEDVHVAFGRLGFE